MLHKEDTLPTPKKPLPPYSYYGRPCMYLVHSWVGGWCQSLRL